MFDLREQNNRIGDRAKAYRLNPFIIVDDGRFKVELLDRYDIHSAMVLGYDILIEEAE